MTVLDVPAVELQDDRAPSRQALVLGAAVGAPAEAIARLSHISPLATGSLPTEQGYNRGLPWEAGLDRETNLYTQC